MHMPIQVNYVEYRLKFVIIDINVKFDILNELLLYPANQHCIFVTLQKKKTTGWWYEI